MIEEKLIVEREVRLG